MAPKRMPSPERRALNIIWTASGDYSFMPSHIACHPDGEPDFYLNSIIGYTRKWYDPSIIDGLFEKISRSPFRETLDGLLWVALENCTFQKESASRPVLAEHRKEYAHYFFQQELFRSRQQWMAQNSLVYAMQAARCRQILGRDPGLVNPWEKKLFRELQYDASMSSEEIAERTLSIFRRYFPLHDSLTIPALLFSLKKKYLPFLKKHLPSRMIRTDTLLMGIADAGGVFSEGRRGLDLNRQSPSARKNDLLYMEGCFGKPLYTDEELTALENRFCTGSHAGCHLYFTDGARPDVPPSDPLIRKVQEDADMQLLKNRAYYKSRYHFYQNSIRKLCEQIRDCLLVCPQPSRLRSRSGSLSCAGIWRGLYLDDPYVFTEALEEPEPDFSVDLMLDASASRLGSQEAIACQGYVITRSLQLCRIPVQVFSFLSIRGYTVIRRFVSYGTKDNADPIFSYFAAGWNRDGLALRGASHLMKGSGSKNRLLIVLSDASPNDDRRIPIDFSKKQMLSRDYSGKTAILDTAGEVRALSKQGIRVCGILTGTDEETGPREIFGSDFVRIEQMDRFSTAAGTLIRKQIEKLTFQY